MGRKTNILAVGFLVAASLLPAQAVSPSTARELGNSLADAVERVMPAVVVVRTESVVYRAARDLFHGWIYRVPERLAGLGSGVIISRDGYVLTSNHVIENARDIEVVCEDGTKYGATRVGHDPATDLAVLRIDAPAGQEFVAVEPADSDAVRIGEFAIAIGSPFSLNSSVTLGIVSQKGRSVGMLPYEDFIQTDASINPGNSGGPLVDIDGRMIGINAAIQTGGPMAPGNVGIGFAVPANLAMRVARSLIASGRVDRAWLGIRLRRLDAEDGRGPRGVLVGSVLDNTPAQAAGLLEGDIILRVDGKPVTDAGDVQRAVFGREVGEKVGLDIERSGRQLQFEIFTGRMPELGGTGG